MKEFEILADCSCDLEQNVCAELKLTLIPGHIRLPDGSEIAAHPGWENTTATEFYSALKKEPNSYTTAPPNVYEFEAVFEEIVSGGKDVLLMTISSGISGAYNFALQAKNNILNKYPDANIYIIDSMRFGPGFGLMVMHAAEMRNSGRGLDEIAAYLEENKNRYHQAGWLDDLSFVAKKGRITHAKAFFGTLAGVKPIGEFDYNGLTTVLGKVKGAKMAYSVLLDYIEQTIVSPEEQTIVIAHTSRLKEAEEYKRLITERFKVKDVLIKDVFPFCGINIGPGLMAAYYVGKPISKDLLEERNTFEQIISGGAK
ncbi:MAG: DegV family protein [Oscillospiraceae bacterium]|nr:DegV family protein [Oscillospiraceae bacterium]